MGASDLSAAHQSIAMVQQRLAALRDLGVDIAPLGRQLAFAEDRLREGAAGDVEAICGDLLATAGRLAQGGKAPAPPLTVAVAAVDNAPARQQAQVLALVDARLADFERRLREQFARELAQVIAARPWEKDLRQALAQVAPAPAVPAAGELDLLRHRLDDLERQVRAQRDALYGGELSSDSGALPAVPRTTRRHQPVTIDGEIPAGDRGAVVAPPITAAIAAAAAVPGEDSASATAACPPASALQPVAAGASPLPSPAEPTAAAAESPTAAELHLLLEIAHQAQDRLATRMHDLESQISQLTERLHRAAEIPAALPVPGEVDASWLARLEDELPSGGRQAMPGLPACEQCTRPETEPPSTSLARTLTPPPVAAVDADAATDGPGPQSGSAIDDAATTRPAGVSSDGLEPLTADQVRRLIDESLTRRLGAALPKPPPAVAASGAALEPLSVDQVKALIDESLTRRALAASAAASAAPPAAAPAASSAGLPAPHTDEEWCERLIQLFPTVVQDPSVRQRLFELIAIESVSRPGVLGELTGMRRLLRRELEAVMQELRRDPVAA